MYDNEKCGYEEERLAEESKFDNGYKVPKKDDIGWFVKELQT